MNAADYTPRAAEMYVDAIVRLENMDRAQRILDNQAPNLEPADYKAYMRRLTR